MLHAIGGIGLVAYLVAVARNCRVANVKIAIGALNNHPFCKRANGLAEHLLPWRLALRIVRTTACQQGIPSLSNLFLRQQECHTSGIKINAQAIPVSDDGEISPCRRLRETH